MKMFYKLWLLLLCVFLLTGCTIEACYKEYQDKNGTLKPLVQNEKVLIIQNDNYGSLEDLTAMIQSNTLADIYNIQETITPDINKYDIILIGDTPVNNQPTSEMISFLQKCDFNHKKVSTYWIGAMDNQTYETQIKKYINNQEVITGLGFNSDEISEKELVSYFINEWLTSLYFEKI